MSLIGVEAALRAPATGSAVAHWGDEAGSRVVEAAESRGRSVLGRVRRGNSRRVLATVVRRMLLGRHRCQDVRHPSGPPLRLPGTHRTMATGGRRCPVGRLILTGPRARLRVDSMDAHWPSPRSGERRCASRRGTRHRRCRHRHCPLRISGAVVAPVAGDISLILWLLLPPVILLRFAVAGRGCSLASAIALILVTPIVSGFPYAVGAYDARPSWEAVAGLLTITAGLFLLGAAALNDRSMPDQRVAASVSRPAGRAASTS